MTARPPISPEQYLRTSFDGPDCEYLDGEIVQRNAGEAPHSRALGRVACRLFELGKPDRLHVYPVLRLQISPTRFRVADVAVFAGEEPTADVPAEPPFIIVEIVSRDDRYTDIVQKLGEYHGWGVAHVWLVDPWLRKLYVYSPSGLNEVPAFQVAELEVRLGPSEIF